MSNAPWFKFYAADYLSSPFVQSLDPEQELWYLRLIIASAISLPRGCLPLADGKLWRLAKAPSKEYFEQNSGAILAKFDKDEVAGVYRVPKVASQQLLTSSELSRKRSEAGKRGAAKKWQSAIRTDGKLPSETMANVKQNIADSDSDSDLERKPSVANASVADDGSKPAIIFNKLNGVGISEALEREGISAQHPVEITPPQGKLPHKTATVQPEIILPVKVGDSNETPDGLNPNQYATRLINPSFFTDGKYRPERRNGNGRQVGTEKPAGVPKTKTLKPTEVQLEQLYKLYPRKLHKLEAKKAIWKAVWMVMAGDPDHPAMPLGY